MDRKQILKEIEEEMKGQVAFIPTRVYELAKKLKAKGIVLEEWIKNIP